MDGGGSAILFYPVVLGGVWIVGLSTFGLSIFLVIRTLGVQCLVRTFFYIKHSYRVKVMFRKYFWTLIGPLH